MNLTGDNPYLVDGIDGKEQAKLYGEPQQVAQHCRDGHYETREINLAENACIGGEGRGCFRQAVIEVLPHADAAEVEQRLRKSVSGYLGDTAENHHVHHYRNHWLDYVPQWAQHSLLILCGDVASYKQAAQITVVPDLPQIELQQLLSWLYYCRPVFVVVAHAECFRLKIMLPTMPQKYFQSVAKGDLRYASMYRRSLS